MVLAIGIACWILLLLGVTVILRDMLKGASCFFLSSFVVALIIALVAIMRPHEDIMGGDDHGAYINAAMSYLRTGTFRIDNDLLRAVDPEARRDFLYYGHGSGIKTALHALRLEDDHSYEQGPWFQVAYPLLLVVPAWIFRSPFAALYVTPILAILAAIAVAGLLRMLFDDRRAGLIGFMLYLSNPILFWHARYVRAEIPSTLFVMMGLYFFFFNGREGLRSCTNILLSILFFGLAVFMHATALLVAIPVAILALFRVLEGKSKYAIFLAAALPIGWLFIWQMAYLVKWYGLENLCLSLLSHALPLSVGFLAATISLLMFARKFPFRFPFKPRRSTGFLVAGLIIVLLSALSFFNSPGRQYFSLLSVSNLIGFANLASRPLTLIGLHGLIAFMTMRPEKNLSSRWLVALLILPGICLGHVVDDYMYGARYFLIYHTTLMSIVLTAFCMAVGSIVRKGRFCAALLASLAIVFTQVGMRSTLYKQTDYRGLTEFYEALVEENDLEDKLLLVEYSRIATPLQHIFGVDTLGLDNEFTLDYRRAFENWSRILEKNPERQAYFITPFESIPVSDLFHFEPVWEGLYEGDRLSGRRSGYPKLIVPWRLRPRLYRMHLRPAESEPLVTADVAVQVLPISAGNAGFANFVHCLNRDSTMVQGVSIGGGEFATVDIAPSRGGEGSDGHLLIFLDPNPAAQPPKRILIENVGGTAVIGLTDLGGGWLAGVSPNLDPHGAFRLKLDEDAELLLTDMFVLSDRDPMPMKVEFIQTSDPVTVPRFTARWARNESSVMIPEGGRGWLLVFAVVPAEIESAVEIRATSVGNKYSTRAEAGVWQWFAFPLESDRPLPQNFEIATDRQLSITHRGMQHPMSLLTGRFAVLEH